MKEIRMLESIDAGPHFFPNPHKSASDFSNLPLALFPLLLRRSIVVRKCPGRQTVLLDPDVTFCSQPTSLSFFTSVTSCSTRHRQTSVHPPRSETPAWRSPLPITCSGLYWWARWFVQCMVMCSLWPKDEMVGKLQWRQFLETWLDFVPS